MPRSRTTGLMLIVGAALMLPAACARLTPQAAGPEPVTSATRVDYGQFGPAQPSSGYGAGGSVVVQSDGGLFGTSEEIVVTDAGPFPADPGVFDTSLADLSSADQDFLLGSGIDVNRDADLVAGLSFDGDDGSQVFFTDDIGATVYFETDSSELSEATRETLRSQAAWLSLHPDIVATVEGHTDERGTREYNIGLGERRASAVRGYLTALGVEGDRVFKVSYGKERPAVDAVGPDGWAQNRRAVTVVLSAPIS